MRAHRHFRPCSALALLAALFASGCGPGGKASGHAGHDHGAHGDEHGDEHGHAGEHGHEEDHVKLSPESIARYGVKVEKAARHVLVPENFVAARAASDPNATAHVGTPVAGRAREVRVKAGDDVKRGDVLVVVDSADLGHEQNEYLARRREAETLLPAVELAKRAYDRGKSFHEESQGITLTELQRRESEWRTAEAAVANARSAVTTAANRLRLLGLTKDAVDRLDATGEIDPVFVVVAPIDGQVVERDVTPGEIVGPDKETLLVIADVRAAWLVADVPEGRLPDVAVGSRARVSVPAVGSAQLTGRVTYIAPEIDASTRTARVRIALDAAAGLRPGMYAQAWIARGGPPPEPVVAIPEEAVQTYEGTTVVFVPAEEPGAFEPQRVSVGAPVGGWVPVHAGLDDGASYVSSGSFLMKAELGKSGAAHEH